MLSSTFFVSFLALLATEIVAKPVRSTQRSSPARRDASDSRTNISIGGQQVSLASYSGDPNSFFGGSLSSKKGNNGKGNNIIVNTKETVQCKKTDVVIIQQRLAILQELMKKVVTTLTCDVETQVTVIEQVKGGIKTFSEDVRRKVTEKSVSQTNSASLAQADSKSVNAVSFDESFASAITKLLDAAGNLSTDDLGLKGTDLGSNSIAPVGDNYNASTSPKSIAQAYAAAKSAMSESSKNATSSAKNATVAASGKNSTKRASVAERYFLKYTDSSK